jgi:RNA polymerase sigma-70 factor, ECF subfamily
VSDADLVARSLNDPHVFEELVSSLSPRIYGYLARRAPQHADDLLSEVWLAAFQNRGQYDVAQAEVAAWMFGIARNVLLAHLRRQRRSHGVPVIDEPHLDEWEAVDRRLDAAGHAPALRRALADLPPEEREVLPLVAWEQLTPSEAAASLGIHPGTARSRLHRARARMTNAWNASAELATTDRGDRHS